MILAALALAGLVQNDPAGATALMQQVLSVSQELSLRRSELGMTYRKRLTVTDIEDEEHPITEKTKTWAVRTVGTGSVSNLIIEDGHTVDGARDERDTDLVEAMRTRYKFKWAPEPITGEGEDRCFNIEFEPINPDRDGSDIEDKITNHLTGTACIDIDRLYVKRIEAHLYKPFKIQFGAKMKRVHLTIVQRLVDGMPVYEWSQTDLYYAFFGFDSVKRHQILYDSWQLQSRPATPTP
jgi:hypothetical protein